MVVYYAFGPQLYRIFKKSGDTLVSNMLFWFVFFYSKNSSNLILIIKKGKNYEMNKLEYYSNSFISFVSHKFSS